MAFGVRRLLVLACAGALVAALVAPGDVRPALAGDTMRCGKRLVRTGHPQDEVLRRCGEPMSRSFSTELVSFETASGLVVTRAVPVETWTYNRGPREFVRYLKFRDGRLIRVVVGDYGS